MKLFILWSLIEAIEERAYFAVWSFAIVIIIAIVYQIVKFLKPPETKE